MFENQDRANSYQLLRGKKVQYLNIIDKVVFGKLVDRQKRDYFYIQLKSLSHVFFIANLLHTSSRARTWARYNPLSANPT